MFKRVFECVRFKASRVMKTKNIFGRKKGNQRKKKRQRERKAAKQMQMQNQKMEIQMKAIHSVLQQQQRTQEKYK